MTPETLHLALALAERTLVAFLALIGAITVVTMVCLLCAHWLGFGNGVNDGEFDGDGIEHEADNWRTHR